MLTQDLIRVKVGKTNIRPRYIQADCAKLLDLSKTLILLFQKSTGEKRSEIEETLRPFHEGSAEYLQTKGLIKLLFDRCEFLTESKIIPLELRKLLFEKATSKRKKGLFNREEILEEVALHLKVSKEALDDDLYSDLRAHQKLKEFKSFTPAGLLHRYNIALAQGVLIKAMDLQVEVQGSSVQYAQLFRYIKFFRLLYQISSLPSKNYQIALDGPLSLFQSSTKYGFQMANFLLALLKMPHFKLKANLLWGKQKKKKQFELDSSCAFQSHFPDPSFWIPEEIQIFKERFQKLNSEWILEENPDILKMEGNKIFVPDYRFLHKTSKEKKYLEILGYWKGKGTLEKLTLFKKNSTHKIILALSKSLLTTKNKNFEAEGFSLEQPAIYVYKRTILAKEILTKLENL